jgi:hypothetical protein
MTAQPCQVTSLRTMPNLSGLFSSDNVIIALIGVASTTFVAVIGGAVGSLLGPLVNWKIEQKRQTRSYREGLIKKWRQMIHDVTLKLAEIERGEVPRPAHVRSPVAFLLEQHPDFTSLKPLLPQSALYEIFGAMTVHVGRTLPHTLIYLIDEIGKIEEKSGLR